MISELQRIEFDLLCQRIASGELSGGSIGTMGEKRLHKTLKYYFCGDETKHEIRVAKSDETSDREPMSGASGKGGYIADAIDGENIIEIQTGSFYPLKPKIKFYLESTDNKITVVHPIAEKKHVIWIDPQCGEISKRNRSPKKGRLSDALPELYWLSEHLKNERLSFKIVLLEIDEYRILNGWSHDRKKGADKYDKIPMKLCDIVEINSENLKETLVPQGLSDCFVSNEFSKLTGLKGRKLSYSLKLLSLLGLIEKGERGAKGYVYKRL